MNAEIFSLTQPSEIELEITPSTQQKAQQKTQSFLQSKERWQSYLNQITLETVISWLQEEGETVTLPWSQNSLVNMGTLVNGSAIMVGDKRIILMPSEAIDTTQLRVPQEWVDIPNWAGDYYLAIQVNPDDHFIRVWGYTTHLQLKEQGNYDYDQRYYALNAEEIYDDVNALLVALELCPQETTRAAIADLPNLPLEQVENLLQRLSHSQIIEPRLAIPFDNWGALLSHDGWRQRLYEFRQGLPEQRSIFRWLESGISELAQQLGWKQLNWQSQFATARGTSSQSLATAFSRPLTIDNQSYELQIMPMGEQGVWRFQLQPTAVGEMIPSGVTLRLLSEDLQPFENNEATATTATESLYLDVALVSGEGIVWETEPQAEEYEREILRF
mgnify:CR=1 FL=1